MRRPRRAWDLSLGFIYSIYYYLTTLYFDSMRRPRRVWDFFLGLLVLLLLLLIAIVISRGLDAQAPRLVLF